MINAICVLEKTIGIVLESLVVNDRLEKAKSKRERLRRNEP